MTDPVSTDMATQAVEQVSTQGDAADEVGGPEGEKDFSEMMGSHEATDVDDVDEVAGIEETGAVESIEEVAQVQTDDFVGRLLEEETKIHEMMETCLDGGGLDQQEMLQMQAVIYSYSQRVELTTKVVEAATGGVEQVMNTQV